MYCVRCSQRGRDRLVRKWRGVMLCVWCRHQIVLGMLEDAHDAENDRRRQRLEDDGLL